MFLNSLISHCAFGKLNALDVARLELVAQPFSIERSEFLNRHNESANGLYLITKGFAKIVWPEKNDKESIIKIVAPGDMTGYRCLFSEESFRATAVSLSTPTTGYFVPKAIFFELLTSNAAFNFEILKLMGIEIKRSENRLRSFANKNVRERLAESLLELNSICGIQQANENKIILDINLTRQEIASWIGTAKETVVRGLADMRDENIIDQVGSSIAIINLEAIRSIAGFKSESMVAF